MSKPISSKKFLELCAKWGIKTIPIQANWATHNRNHKGPFEDVHGVMVHHTGAFTSVDQMAKLLWNGYPGLSGPLCHSGIDPAGHLRLAGWGRTNHAGLGSSAILRRVKQSDLPISGNLKPGEPDVDGNAHFYGFEIIADGKTPMTEAQRVTAVRVTAALCTAHDWDADVIAHGEWQQGKWDPGANGKLIDMGDFRSWVRQAIKEGPKKPLPNRPKPIEDKPLPSPPNIGWETITVKEGDTLLGLAKKAYPTLSTNDALLSFVYDNAPSLLKPGTKLHIPKK